MGILKKSGAYFFVGVKERFFFFFFFYKNNNFKNNNWDLIPSPLEFSSFVLHSLYLSIYSQHTFSNCNLEFVESC